MVEELQVSQTGFVNDEHLQVMWTGARYAFTDSVDAGVAYYHYDQNSYGKTFCGNNSAATGADTLDAVSVNVDGNSPGRATPMPA